MFDRVTEKIMIHIDTLKSGIKASLMILDSAIKEESDNVDFWADNRERLISLTAQRQKDVEDILKNLPQEEATKENLEIVRAWFDDTQNWIQSVSSIDEEIMKVLSAQKEEITQEIASAYKTRQVFSGYNLKSVHK